MVTTATIARAINIWRSANDAARAQILWQLWRLGGQEALEAFATMLGGRWGWREYYDWAGCESRRRAHNLRQRHRLPRQKKRPKTPW